MGLRQRLHRALARAALHRPHILLVTAPGGTSVRLAAEARITATGSVLAQVPADADVLLVAGWPGEELAAAVGRAWAQVSGPRVQTQVGDAQEVPAALREALDRLASPDHGVDARTRDGGKRSGPDPQPDHGPQHAQGEGQQQGHGDHHGGGMSMPGGLGMAGRAPDRDGLKLDILHVPLGPVLPAWPSGLVVDTVLQGDVVQRAEARLLAPSRVMPPFWNATGDRTTSEESSARHDPGARNAGAVSRRSTAAHLDSLNRLLDVAGWAALAGLCRQTRDALLRGAPARQVRDDFETVARRMRRSLPLRWATDGLGVLGEDAARRLGVTGPALRACARGGDVTARWQQWLDETGVMLAGGEAAPGEGPRGRLDGRQPPSTALLDAALALLPGQDLAGARLVLASLDPDPDELARAPAGSVTAGKGGR